MLREQDILEHWLSTDSEQKHPPTRISLKNSFFQCLDFQESLAASDCVQCIEKEESTTHTDSAELHTTSLRCQNQIKLEQTVTLLNI